MQPQDFNSMQEKALQYAREMKKIAQSANSDQTHSATHRQNRTDEYGSKKSSEFNSRYNSNNSFSGIKNIFSSGNTPKTNNNDISLILSLILLLSSDGGDRLLMLALLYIMT